MNQKTFEKIFEYGVVPVIAIESADFAVDLADTLINGNLPVAEITFRTEAAADTIRIMKKEHPDMIIGAGTVLTIDDLQKAKDMGADFAVAPGLNPHIVTRAKEIGLEFVPGVSNPTDVEQAISLGCKKLKFFPAEACGGIKMLNSIYAPYKHLGIKFMPTGGISVNNLQIYLKDEAIFACGGTWIAKMEDIKQGRWSDIIDRCREVRELVKSVR